MRECPSELCAQHLSTIDGNGRLNTLVDAEYILRTNACSSDGIDLPEPDTLEGSLSSALRERRSAAAFAGTSISLSMLGNLIAESAGVSAVADQLAAAVAPGPRPYPSGGALYPIELALYPLRVDGLAARFWSYQTLANRLVPITHEIAPSEVISCYANESVRDAAVLILLFADFTRPTLSKYGGKTYRLLLLEAGHLAQNILLVATSLNLAALPLCGFADERLARLVGLAFPAQSVLYTIALGVHA